MSDLEKFREVTNLQDYDHYLTARVIQNTEGQFTLLQLRPITLNVSEARALRDWLNEVIP